MKKTISVICILAMLLQLFSMIPVGAADGDKTPTITVATVDANPGDTEVGVAISIANNPGLYGLALRVEYSEYLTLITNLNPVEEDPNYEILLSKLEHQGLRRSTLWPVEKPVGSPIYTSPVTLIWDSISPDTTNGNIITLEFSVSSDAKGLCAISVVVDPEESFDGNYAPFSPTIVNGGIKTPGGDTVPVSDITITDKVSTLCIGKTYTLKAKVSPDSATVKTVSWYSDSDAVTIDSSTGKVTANKIGSATITAKAGTKTDTCTITVQDHSVNTWNKVNASTHTGNCSVCGTTVTESHSFGEWMFAGINNHKRTCVCGAEETESHSWDNGETVTEATHTSEGKKVYTCSVCKGTKEEIINPDPTHNFGEWENYTNELHKRTCECGRSETQAHNFGNWVKVDENTHKRVCSVCGAEEISKHCFDNCEKYNADSHKLVCECGAELIENHIWEDGDVITYPTHTAAGSQKQSCKCGAEQIVTIEPLSGHSYTKIETYDADNHKLVCICGDSITEPHDWNDGEETIPATHTSEGVKTYTCKKCGETKTASIPPLTEHSYTIVEKNDKDTHKLVCSCSDWITEEHSWDNGKVTTPATHTSVGERTYSCKVCGETKTEVIPKTTTHTFKDWVSDGAETHTGTCACKETKTEDHNWQIKVTKAATHTSEGVKTYTCKVCGETKTEAIPKTTTHTFTDWTYYDEDSHIGTCACSETKIEAHKWDSGVVTNPATSTEEGVRTYTCSVCKATRTEAIPVNTEPVHPEPQPVPDVPRFVTDPYQNWLIGMLYRQNYTITAIAGPGGKITPSGDTIISYDQSMAYTIQPDAGYEIDRIIVNGQKVAAASTYVFENVKSNQSISVEFRKAEWVNPFKDVKKTDAYYDAVAFLYEKGIMKGMSETEFAPKTEVTRAMFVTLLGRLAGVDTAKYTGSSFSDIEKGAYYQPYVEWAVKAGLVKGYTDGTFGVNKSITAEEAMVILARYAEFSGKYKASKASLNQTDAGKVSDWALDAVKWAVANKVYVTGNGTLNPQKAVIRSLAAQLLCAYITEIDK